jgi:hypothetical protein
MRAIAPCCFEARRAEKLRRPQLPRARLPRRQKKIGPDDDVRPISKSSSQLLLVGRTGVAALIGRTRVLALIGRAGVLTLIGRTCVLALVGRAGVLTLIGRTRVHTLVGGAGIAALRESRASDEREHSGSEKNAFHFVILHGLREISAQAAWGQLRPNDA